MHIFAARGGARTGPPNVTVTTLDVTRVPLRPECPSSCRNLPADPTIVGHLIPISEAGTRVKLRARSTLRAPDSLVIRKLDSHEHLSDVKIKNSP